MTAFELVAKLVADTSGFDSAMGKAEKSGKNLKNSLENTFGKIKKIAAGALSVAVIKKGVDSVISLANEVSSVGDKIDKQSQALGLSRKAYQEWDYILGQNGASIDSLGVSMKTLNSLVLSAGEGSKEAKDSFAKLGLGIHELDGLSMEQQFEAVVRAFQKMPAGAKKSALAVQMFGRNGMELLPLLNQADTSIDELRQRAEELGIIMSDDAVDASVAYNDAMDDLNRTFTGIRNTFGARLLPTFTSAAKKITDYAGRISNAYKNAGISGVLDTISGSLGNVITKLKNSDSPVLQLLGSSLEGIKTTVEIISGLFADFDGTVATLQQSDKPVLQQVGNGLATVKNVFNWIVDNKESVAAAVGAIIAAFAATKIVTFVASINPLTIIFAAIAAGIALVATNWDKIKDWIGKAWKTTITWVNEKWQAVSDAFASAKEWVSEEAHKIKLAWSATVDSWIETIKSWLDGTGLSEIAINFGATVAEWIQRIYDWVTNGVSIAVKFFSNGLGVSSTGDDSWSSNSSSNYNPHGFNLLEGLEDGSNAKGLNYVPFDNYLARLHRGEQVLTASQARRYRSGSGGGIDIAAFAQSMIAAVREGMDGAEVNSFMDGRRVTGGVNRRTMNQLKARRFQT